MTTSEIDPRLFKEEQQSNWDGVSSGWQEVSEIFERGGAHVTSRLLTLADLRAGQSVLDVATGHGQPALSAAEQVGPSGRVTGIDLSEGMLDVARKRGADLPQLAFRQGDAESLDFEPGSFDVVLSRWGLMFVLDQLSAFRGLRRVLRPGGVLAAAVWGPPSSVRMLCSAFQVLSKRLQLPAPPSESPAPPGPFSMSDPVQLTEIVTAAGFTDVSVTEFTVPFWLHAPEEFVTFNKAVIPPGMLGKLRDRFGSADDPETWQMVASSVEPDSSGDRIMLPATALCLKAIA